MKYFLVVGVVMWLGLGAAAQDTLPEREVKEGWVVGAFPTLTYSNTLGFQFGACGNVFYYGDGTSYPDPLHKFSFEASHFTKGRSRFWLALDSKSLLPGWRVTLSALDIMDPLYFFYGYNGAAQPYSAALNDELHYNVDRNIFQAFANFQRVIVDTRPRQPQAAGSPSNLEGELKEVGGSQAAGSPSSFDGELKVVAGVSFSNYRLCDYDGSAYGGNDTATLYRDYIATGLIGSEEAQGGNVLEVRGGLVYDTRDFEAAPNRGFLLEAFLNPGFSPQHSYLKACLYFSHFLRVPLGVKPGDPVFAYRLGCVATLTGDAPWYMQQSIPMLVPHTMLTEGFGSAKTLRGYYENRIIADGMLWGNFELRIKLVKFTLWKQFFYIAVNPFFDCGVITQSYRLDRQAALDGWRDPVTSFGLGLKGAWNENFIVSAEVAHCTNRSLGDPFWIDLGVNYVF